MEIDFEKLRRVIERHARPRWEKKTDEEWRLRDGGGETYLQDKVLKNASPYLTEEEIDKGAKEAISNALKYQENLNHRYDLMYASTFVDPLEENELRSHLRAFLYGPEEVETRLKRLLEWAKVVQVPGTTKKKGLTLAIASYLLAMTRPREYPFCKPIVYNSAVDALLGKAEKKSDPVERFSHCKQFYSSVLEFLEKRYGLVEGNLLDVHSLFFLFRSNNWSLREEPKPPPTIYDLLVDKHNVVLYGPPGTGKTRDALELGQWWRVQFGLESVTQVTFHPSYSYEDFVEGFRPAGDGSRFELVDGVFKRLCNAAAEQPEKRFLLIIDEINRGDVARILGELITLLEGDKRGQEFSALLPGSKQPFFVPKNIYVLGTMNTADRSISLMDLAIRRRFLFYPCPPKPQVLEDDRELLAAIGDVNLAELLIGLNQRLLDVGIDRDRLLGQSYLMIRKETERPLDALKTRVRYEIYPLMEEYCYSDRSLLKRVLGGVVDEWGMLNEDLFDADEEFLSNLTALTKTQ